MKKLVIGYDYKYYIDDEGYFYNKNGKRISGSYSGGGYKQVSMCLKGRYVKMYVHRLVGLYFIPNPHNKKEINHIDMDKTNNSITNLERVTRSENESHKQGIVTKIIIQQAIYDIGSKAARGRKYGVSDVTIGRREKKYLVQINAK